MTTPFLPIHEFILLGMSDHPAWPKMVQEVIKRGIPKYYVRDFTVHDVNTLAELPRQLPFYWGIRIEGTWLTEDRSIMNQAGRYGTWAWFQWTGTDLVLLEQSNV